MNIFELVVLLVSILLSTVDNILRYIERKIIYRLLFAIFLFVLILTISIGWIKERNEIEKIKGTVEFFLTDENLFTKLKSENEIEEYLAEFNFDKEKCLTAIIAMLRNKELVVEKKKVWYSELEQNYDLNFFFLSREFIENNQKTPHNNVYKK